MKTTPKTIQTRSDSGQRETRAYALQIKAAGDDGSVEGYGSVFGVRDNYDDVIAKGAFLDSLKSHKAAGTMPAMLWQHDSSQPIGVWTDMVEDERGLRIVGKLAMETTKGKEAHSLLKMGALNGLSIGFMSKQWAYDRDTEVRTLTEIELWEVSLVTFPANTAARVTGIKSAVDEITAPRDAERILREAGFSKTDATAYVSRVLRMGAERREAELNTDRILRCAPKAIAILTN